MLFTEREKLQEDIEALLQEFGCARNALIPVLLGIQHKHSHISEYAMQLIADKLKIFPVEVYSVVTFYRFLNETPQGKFIIRLCRTISCDLAGKDRVASQLETELDVKFGETTPDGLFTLEWANCIGMCDQGPALLVNDQVFTRMTPDKVQDILHLCKCSIEGGN